MGILSLVKEGAGRHRAAEDVPDIARTRTTYQRILVPFAQPQAQQSRLRRSKTQRLIGSAQARTTTLVSPGS